MKYIETVVDVVNNVKKELGKNNWKEVTDRLQKLFPNKQLTTEGVRSTYRRHGKTLVNPDVTTTKTNDALKGNITLEDRLFPRIQKKTSVTAVAELLGVSEDNILLAVAKLQMQGHPRVRVWQEGGKTFVQNMKKAKEYGLLTDISEKWKNTSKISIGVVSDTHIGSEYANETALNHFYDLLQERGISIVLHAGDVFEGYNIKRPETFFNNVAVGFQNQLERGIAKYPKREGITTYMISGNHDEWYIQKGFADIVKTLSMTRGDLVFLGNSYAKIKVTPKIDITLFHPNDGSAANVYGKLQNFVSRAGVKLSKINILGHYHKLAWLYMNDVHAFYPASFQRQSSWMNLNNLRSEVGAIILNLTVNNETGELLALNFEHVDYNDYNEQS